MELMKENKTDHEVHEGGYTLAFQAQELNNTKSFLLFIHVKQGLPRAQWSQKV